MTLQVNIRQEIYHVVSLIPEGKVATYGQIARLAGFPKHARLVGYALNNLDGESDLPWHRVINAQGKISLRGADGMAESRQQQKLAAEGVIFKGDRIPLSEYQWQP